MITVAVINQKGGVGKTTSAVTLAHALARLGRPTLLVDLDAQGNVADALGLSKSPGLYSLLILGTELVTPSGREGLDVILSDKRTVEAKQILAGRDFREQALAEALSVFYDLYDVCIFDVAPGVDVLQVGALVACDLFFMPVALDHLAVVGAADALASAASLNRMRMGGRFVGILPTMWERTTKESHEQLQALSNRFGRLVWPPIPLDVKAREAPAFGKTLWEYAPQCRAVMGVKVKHLMVGGYGAAALRLLQEVDHA